MLFSSTEYSFLCFTHSPFGIRIFFEDRKYRDPDQLANSCFHNILWQLEPLFCPSNRLFDSSQFSDWPHVDAPQKVRACMVDRWHFI